MLSHHHPFKKIDLVDVVFTCVIKLNCSMAEFIAIKCLETTNDASVTWLHKWGQVWFEKFQLHVCWFIIDCMPREIVHKKADPMVHNTHFVVKFLQPSVACNQ